MKHLILIGLIVLAGCDIDNPTEESYTETQHDPNTGLTLKPSDKMWVSFPELVSIYVGTEACLGLTAPGPDVEYKSFARWYLGGAWGLYLANGELVMVNTDEQQGLGFPTRDADTDTQVLRHEFIHHILYMNGVPYRDGYSPDLFAKCGQGVDVNN